ncbi:MAG: hypothetical protein GC159_10890, partial [Phycisphaera sp.]|nr:hypothetical protein [Phycisphaera sp.]
NHATRDRFAGPTLRFAERRLDLDAVGDQADLAILNANHATTAELLLKGVPSFHLPISTEQARLADRLESTGACHRASYVDLDSVFSALHRMLDDMGSHRIHAEAFARKHAEFDSETSSRNMTERILEIASSRSADTPRPVPPPTATVPSLGRRSVLVLGCGRSGTSMVTGVLANAGWRLGGRPFPPGQSNPKGFFETGEVNSINERLLAELFPEPQFRYGQRWLCRVPAGARFEPTPEIVAQIAHLASERPFAFKDPRFCDTLPAWRPHIDNAAFICVFRHPAVTAQSILTECESRTYLKDMTMSFNLALAIWTSKYEQALRRHAEGGDWLFIHYDQMLTAAGLDRLERFVGAPVDRSFPTSSLARTQCNKPVPHPVQQLYARLCELADVSTTPNAAASR